MADCFRHWFQIMVSDNAAEGGRGGGGAISLAELRSSTSRRNFEGTLLVTLSYLVMEQSYDIEELARVCFPAMLTEHHQ